MGCGVGSGVVVGILPILAHILCGYKATTMFQAVVPVVVIKLLSCDSNVVFFIRVVSNVRCCVDCDAIEHGVMWEFPKIGDPNIVP